MQGSGKNNRRAYSRQQRGIDAHTIGSHVNPSHTPRHSARSVNNPRARHSRPLRTETATYDKHRSPSRRPASVDVNPEPVEKAPEFARRSKAKPIAVIKQSKRKVRAIAIGLVVLAITLIIALLVGQHVFFKTTDANFEDVESNASEALVSSTEGPVVFLLEADLSFKNLAKNSDDALSYMLVRLDNDAHTLSFLTIPAKLQVTSTNDDSIILDEAKSIGGDAELISAIAEKTGIKINHFVSTNAAGLSRLVDAIGGVSVDIETEIDDPNAGIIVMPAGERDLDGEEALVYLRNTNHAKGFEQTAHNRVNFTYLLLSKALDTQGFDFANIISEASNFVSTDMPTSNLMDIANASRPLSDLTLFEATLPTSEVVVDGNTTFKLDSKEWESVKAAFEDGGKTDRIDDNSIPNSDISIEVRNGANITGAAAKLGDILSGFGYTVDGVGNTNDGVIYPETLVIYTDPIYKGAAEDILSEISSGRTVNGGDYYSSESDIIVIIGSDWSIGV